MTTTPTTVHPAVKAMPDKVLYGRTGSALVWLQRNLTPGQVPPRLDDLAQERRARRTRGLVQMSERSTS